MKKLTQKEVAKMEFKVTSKGMNPVLSELRKLNVGESLLIEKTDWKPKTHPRMVVSGAIRARNGMRFSIRTLKDEIGWIATRIK